jgi:hypothetical protein
MVSREIAAVWIISFFEILKPFFPFFIAVFAVVIHVIMMVIVITHFGYSF